MARGWKQPGGDWLFIIPSSMDARFLGNQLIAWGHHDLQMPGCSSSANQRENGRLRFLSILKQQRKEKCKKRS